jgi:hypothetical protein
MNGNASTSIPFDTTKIQQCRSFKAVASTSTRVMVGEESLHQRPIDCNLMMNQRLPCFA